MTKTHFAVRQLVCAAMVAAACAANAQNADMDIAGVRAAFENPPDSAKPGVYWYFMDGNLSREGMTRDLESMKEAGIAHVVFLEVSVGVPRGKVDFMSDEWLELFKHANAEAERLGIAITLGTGPGWAGSGGPWVKPEQSMRHLVASEIKVSGGDTITTTLPVPPGKRPFFGEGTLTPELRKQWEAYYEDVAVLAFPTPTGDARTTDSDEKALYYRPPYTSQPGVKPYFVSSADHDEVSSGSAIPQQQVRDLTSFLKPDGTLTWDAPEGNWTIMRFGARNNGMVTRPAPAPGLGFECDKFSREHLASHLDNFVGKIFEKLGPINTETPGGLAAIHIDSWEMGAQNWTDNFAEEFKKRRGYDPLPYYPAYTGLIVESRDVTERFLWDLRLTSQELIIENHAEAVKEFSHSHGLKLSIEPYDMNPAADIDLGAVADIPMCEFWSKGFGFNAAFSCLEATSIGHIEGKNVVQAESFTADPGEGWLQYPGSMKNQGDWAFALGINRFFYHTFAHQPLDEKLLPGMTMGPYGVHWDRKQTWWPMAGEYHKYVARCQAVLQQGRAVADVLYLNPAGAPHVFVPPPSALAGDSILPDKRAYSFDACSPNQLMKATVQNGRVTFPSGASYRMLVLPASETMTVELLTHIQNLATDGAIVVGAPPEGTPDLKDYRTAETRLATLAKNLWNAADAPSAATVKDVGKGKLVWGGELAKRDGQTFYPSYQATSAVLRNLNIDEDFSTTAPVRYHHRQLDGSHIYFLANRTTETLSGDCGFRATGNFIEIWDPLTGRLEGAQGAQTGEDRTTLTMSFGPHQSYFVIFSERPTGEIPTVVRSANQGTTVTTLSGPWTVAFKPELGGPEKVSFPQLVDWTTHSDKGIKYYSGIATYTTTFEVPADLDKTLPLYLGLGDVKNLAKVRVNGQDAGTVWTAPWQVEVGSLIKTGTNQLEVEVANLWVNRLIGDLALPNTGIEKNQWPQWLLEGKEQPGERVTFTTYNPHKPDTPLQPSGLLGPVTLQQK